MAIDRKLEAPAAKADTSAFRVDVPNQKESGGEWFRKAQEIHVKLMKSKTGIFAESWRDAKAPDEKSIEQKKAKITFFQIVIARGGCDEVSMRDKRLQQAKQAMNYYISAHNLGIINAASELFKLNGLFKGKLVEASEMANMINASAAQGHGESKQIAKRLEKKQVARLRMQPK